MGYRFLRPSLREDLEFVLVSVSRFSKDTSELRSAGLGSRSGLPRSWNRRSPQSAADKLVLLLAGEHEAASKPPPLLDLGQNGTTVDAECLVHLARPDAKADDRCLRSILPFSRLLTPDSYRTAFHRTSASSMADRLFPHSMTHHYLRAGWAMHKFGIEPASKHFPRNRTSVTVV